MRRLMGVIKDRHGTYYAQQRVPEPLQAAVARVLNNGKRKQVFLKKSLGTKILKEANVRAKPVQMGFDQIIRRATELVAAKSAPKPTKRQSLNPAEITRMTEAFFGKLLAEDEEMRFGGRASVVRFVEWMRRNKDPDFVLPYPLESVPEFGISPERLADYRQQNADALTTARELLATGDIRSIIEDEMALLFAEFDIELDRKSPSYRELGTHLLRPTSALSKQSTSATRASPSRPLSSPLVSPPVPPVVPRCVRRWRAGRKSARGLKTPYRNTRVPSRCSSTSTEILLWQGLSAATRASFERRLCSCQGHAAARCSKRGYAT
jgi:hypothetical protein